MDDTGNQIQCRREDGERQARNPLQWEGSTRALLYASEILWETHTRVNDNPEPGAIHNFVNLNDRYLGNISYLLAGFAVENLLKACLVCEKKDAASHNYFYTHNLLKLAKLAGIEPSSKEYLTLMEELTHIIEWSGRYPIPTWNTPKGKNKWAFRYLGDDDRQQLEGFISKVYERYYELSGPP